MRLKKRNLIFLVMNLLLLNVITFKFDVKANEDKIVSLGNQKKDIDNALTVKSITKLENFEGWYWIDEHRLIASKNQFIFREDETLGEFVVYDTLNKKEISIDKIHPTKDGYDYEFMASGDYFLNKDLVIYRKESPMGGINGVEALRTVEKYKLLNTKNYEVIEISDKASDCMVLKEQNKFMVAEGFKIYFVDLNGKREEIKLPEKLVTELKDMSKYSLEEYLNDCTDFTLKEYLEDKEKASRCKYNEYKNNPQIVDIMMIGDELAIKASNNKSAIYNLKNETFKIIDEDKRKSWSEKRRKNEKKENENKVKRVIKEEGKNKDHIWVCDEFGKKKKIIDSGEIRLYDISPDQQKFLYRKKIKGEEGRRCYIYDISKQKRTEIFVPNGFARWNSNSDKVFISSSESVKKENGESYYQEVTYIMELK